MCEYGCGQEAKYQLKNGKWCCSKNYQSCSELKRKNSEKIKQLYSKNKLDAKSNYRKLSKQKKEKMNWSKGKCLIPFQDVFCENTFWSTSLLKKYISFYQLKENVCEQCGIEKWNGKQIVLECHHLDGDKTNNKLQNLKLLCPNCHSQTQTFRGRNINSNRKKVTDEYFIKILKEQKNIRKALIRLGLAPFGANYDRAKKLLNKISKTIKN